MKGVLNPEPLEPLTSVSAWLNYAQPARKAVAPREKTLSPSDFLLALTERNVVEQLGNLRTHPSVAARLEHGDLRLHGWVYYLGEGIVTAYDAGKEAFVPLESPKPKLRAVRQAERTLIR
jgi:carbonic anhydrase